MQFDEHLCDISHGFNWHGASRGPSATAELLVYIYVSNIILSVHCNLTRTFNGPLVFSFISFVFLHVQACWKHQWTMRTFPSSETQSLCISRASISVWYFMFVFGSFRRTNTVFTLCDRLYNRSDEVGKWAQSSGAWAGQPGRLWRHCVTARRLCGQLTDDAR